MVDEAPCEGVSSTSLRKRWWVSKKFKLLSDGTAVALLRAHDEYVYAPLKKALVGNRGKLCFFFVVISRDWVLL